MGEAFREGAVSESALGPGGRSPTALVGDTLGIITITRCNYFFQPFLWVSSRSQRRHLLTMEVLLQGRGSESCRVVGIGRKNALGRLCAFKGDFSKGCRALWRADDSGVTLRSSRFALKIHRTGQTETQSMQVLNVNSKTPKTSGKSTQEVSTTSVARKAALTECLSPHPKILCSGARR